MTTPRYSFQNFDPKIMVKVAGRNLPISYKSAYEVANFIKGKKLVQALTALDKVVKKEIAVPYRRYNRNVAHKPGKLAAGRYPVKTSQHVIRLLKNLQGAARLKGFDIQKLKIIHAAVQKGPVRRRYGRKQGLERKNSHFEVVAQEFEIKK